MNFESYIADVRSDVADYAESNGIDARFYDMECGYDAWIEDIIDDITGNLNGSYYCNAYRAAKELGGILVDINEVNEFLDDYDMVESFYGWLQKGDVEGADVVLRWCIAISQNFRDIFKKYEPECEESED